MNSREAILVKLKAARPPFGDVPPVETRRAMVPGIEPQPKDLQARFITEARKLNCAVTAHAGPGEALAHLLALIGEDRRLLSWDPAHIPLPGLGAALAHAGVEIAAPADASIRVGLTGAEAALASTGSVILRSGPGRPRTTSLLPDLHIVVITTGQIMPTLEAWAAAYRVRGLAEFEHIGSLLIVSGPSRTADIAMQLVMGAHGPSAVHVLILP